MTFSDQMSLAAELVNSEFREDIAHAERAKYKIVLLDEYQDTSYSQVRFLTGLFGADSSLGIHSVTAVGDPNQSIYGWRSASAGTISAFPKEFGAQEKTEEFTLLTTWRNERAILDLANKTIEKLNYLANENDRYLKVAKAMGSVNKLDAREDAGPGEVVIGQYESMASEIGLDATDVLFTGSVPSEDISSALAACDVLVMPFPDHPHYRLHMSPLKMFEYMAAGRIIVTSDLPTVRDVLSQDTAVFFKAGDMKSLVAALRWVIEHPDDVGILLVGIVQQCDRDNCRQPDAGGKVVNKAVEYLNSIHDFNCRSHYLGEVPDLPAGYDDSPDSDYGEDPLGE